MRWWLVGGVAGAALLSLLLFPQEPVYDAWLWLDWGRHLAHGEITTDAGLLPVAWKPLPSLVAAPLSLTGGWAPDLWVLLVRIGAAASFVLAYLLGRRAGGAVAGYVAALALALVPGWWIGIARADAEPILVALALGAVELHLTGRRGAALAALLGAALIRPEAWVFLAGYAVWTAAREPRLRLVSVAALAAVPALWFGLDWLGSGDPLTGPGTARSAAALTSLSAAAENVLGALAWPLWIAVGLGVFAGFALRRAGGAAGPGLLVLALAIAAALWLAEVVILAGFGYVGSERFVVAAAALLCPVIGAGVAFVVGGLAPRARALAIAGLLALSVPLVLEMGGYASDQFEDLPEGDTAGLQAAVEAAGGRERLLGCPGPVIAETLRAPLVGYVLEVPTESLRPDPFLVGGSEAAMDGVMVRGPARGDDDHDPAAGTPDRLGRAGGWVVAGRACAGEPE